jgi:hypothetical protein
VSIELVKGRDALITALVGLATLAAIIALLFAEMRFLEWRHHEQACGVVIILMVLVGVCPRFGVGSEGYLQILNHAPSALCHSSKLSGDVLISQAKQIVSNRA